jgi:uncharacterized protein (DUF2267 family)
VDYVGFLDAVARRAGLPPEEAATIAGATLETLAERISGGQARDLAAQLPDELRTYVRKEEDELPQRLNAMEFVREVRARAGVDDQWASEGARAVFTTLRETVSGAEFNDLVSELPKDIRDLLHPADRRVEASP